MNAESIAAVVVPLALLAIPVVAILTSHQRKMAELIHSRHGERNEALQGRVAQLEAEVQDMRDRMNTSAIESDRLRALMTPEDRFKG